MVLKILAELIKKEMIKEDIFKFTVKNEELANLAKPGNFLEIRVSENVEPFLRRPISIHNIDKQNGTVDFIFQVKGNGTHILAKKEIGDKIDILGPLGYGTFNVENQDRIAVIGGGIGIFPLYELCKQAKQNNVEVNTYLGFRNKELVVLEEDFKKVSNNLTITTDDGSYAKNGYAIAYLEKDIENIDTIYACGPLVMLRKVKELAIKYNKQCYVSLEERMGCGIGVCLGCAVKTAKSSKEAPEYVHVCKLGPVFLATDVEF